MDAGAGGALLLYAGPVPRALADLTAQENAPQSGDRVKISEIWLDELVGTVTRPGA
jgi:hypothetical protein